MALSLIEMNYIKNRVVRPLDATLIDLVILSSRRHGKYLKDTEKTFDIEDPENADALACLNKQNALIASLNNGGNVFVSFEDGFIFQMGNLVNFADVRGWAMTEWDTFLSNNVPAVFDNVAGITATERTAYNAI